MCSKICISLIFFALISCSAPSDPVKDQIKKAVSDQISQYPALTLQDMYKSFFQDRFGPGHLIPDTASANAYLRQELAESDSFAGPYFEPTGYKGDFYRVNLSVLHQNLVPFAVYSQAFCESVNSIQFPSMEDWSKEWAGILAVIRSMNLNLPHFEEDVLAIEQLLQKGEYVVHHSDAFVKAYDPHYRIISRTMFEQRILPLLKP